MNALRKHLCVIAAYAVITAALTWPLPRHLSNGLLAAQSGDPLLQVWVIQWNIHKLTTSLSRYFDANIFYPYLNTFAYHDHLFGLSLLGLPVQLLGRNPILTFNLLFLLSFALSAYSMFLLADALCRNRYAAFAAGLIFGFLPYRFAHLDHLNLLSVYWLPLCLLALSRYIQARAVSRDGLTRLILLGWGGFALQVLTSFNYLFMTTLTLALYGAALAAWRWKWERALLTAVFRKDALPFVLGGCFVAGALFPLTIPYLRANREMGFTRTTAEIRALSATLPNYLAAPEQNRLYGGATVRFRAAASPYPREQILFNGILPMLLAASTLPLLLKRAPAEMQESPILKAFWLLLSVSVILSFGPTLTLFHHDIPLPYRYLYDYLPGFKSMRVPARFGVIAAFCVAMLAAFAIARLESRVKNRGILTGLRLMLAAGILLEYWSAPHAVTPYAGRFDQIPPVYRWISQQPADMRLIELPASAPKDQFESLYYSTFHWKRLVNGRSAFIPDGIASVFEEMRLFPAPRTLALLRSLGVDAALVHADKLPVPLPKPLPAGLEIARQFGGDLVLTFTAPSASPPSLPYWKTNFRIPSTAQAGQVYLVGIELMPTTSKPFSPLPQDRAQIAVIWEKDAQAVLSTTQTVSLPVVCVDGEWSVASLRMETPAEIGAYRVRFETADERFAPRSFEQQVTLAREFADSRTAQPFRADILHADLPPIWKAGEPLPARVIVRNRGGALWRARIEDRPQPVGEVRLGVKAWRDEASGAVVAQPNLEARARLPHDVAPGEHAVISALIPTPPTPGTYQIECDFVSEQVQWFARPFFISVTLQ